MSNRGSSSGIGSYGTINPSSNIIQGQQQHDDARRRSSVLIPKQASIKKPSTLLNYGSLLLENKGSVARDHLASERTFLAWLRTSLSLASIGVGVTQLLKLGNTGDSGNDVLLKRFSKAIGLSFLLIATLTLSIGTARYFSVQKLLTTRNQFPASSIGVLSVCFAVVVLSIAVLVVVLKL